MLPLSPFSEQNRPTRQNGPSSPYQGSRQNASFGLRSAYMQTSSSSSSSSRQFVCENEDLSERTSRTATPQILSMNERFSSWRSPVNPNEPSPDTLSRMSGQSSDDSDDTLDSLGSPWDQEVGSISESLASSDPLMSEARSSPNLSSSEKQEILSEENADPFSSHSSSLHTPPGSPMEGIEDGLSPFKTPERSVTPVASDSRKRTREAADRIFDPELTRLSKRAKNESTPEPFYTPSPKENKNLRPPKMNKRRFEVKSSLALTRAREYRNLDRLLTALKCEVPESFEISLGTYLGSGQFSDVFLLYYGESMQIIKVSNFQEQPSGRVAEQRRAIEILNYLQVVKVSNFQQEIGGRFFIENRAMEILNYFQLKNIGFPIASCHNIDEKFDAQSVLEASHLELHKMVREKFDGYYRTDYIPQDFLSRETLQDLSDKMLKMNPEELKYFEETLRKENHPVYQVKQMFQLAHKHEIPVDLKPDNVRIQEDGTVLLCDLFYEEHEGSQNPMDYLTPQKLLTFADEGSPLWEYLDPRFLRS